jgi:RHS repeat-associated protein
VWLGDIPVATLKPSGSAVAVYYIHTDHLNTPRQITRPSDNAQLWTWFSDPFGTDATNTNPAGAGPFNDNLRFPGQIFNGTAGLHQNQMRDYDPATGRYIESDPSGLRGGANPYAYTGSNPLLRTDPLGLSWDDNPPRGPLLAFTKPGGPVPTGLMVSMVVAVLLQPEGPGELYAAGAISASAGVTAATTEAAVTDNIPLNSGATAFAGHGLESALAGTTTVPPGVAITLPGTTGLAMPDSLGQLIEAGAWQTIAADPEYSLLMQGTTTYLPGAVVPDLILLPPTGLSILPGSVTVTSDTMLSELLNEARGPCVWAACRQVP